MSRFIVAAAGAALLAVPGASIAQKAATPAPAAANTAPAPAVDPARLALANRLVGLLQLDGILDTMFRQLTPLVVTGVFAAIDNAPDAPAEVKRRLTDPANRRQAEAIMGEEVLKSYRARFAQIADATAREYATRFDEADLKAAIAFYESPTGKKFIAAQPAIQAVMSERGRAIGADAGREAIPAAIARIEKLPAPAK